MKPWTGMYRVTTIGGITIAGLFIAAGAVYLRGWNRPVQQPVGTELVANANTEKYRFRPVDAGTVIGHAFTIDNSTKNPIGIKYATVSCAACTKIISMPTTIKAGNAGIVRVKMDTSGKHGDASSDIILYTDDPSQKKIVLSLIGKVRNIWIVPDLVQMQEVDRSSGTWAAKCRVLVAGYKGVRISQVTSPPGVTATVLHGSVLGAEQSEYSTVGWIAIQWKETARLTDDRNLIVYLKTDRGDREVEVPIYGLPFRTAPTKVKKAGVAYGS